MIYTTEVQHMCPVAKGAYHGPAPIPEEGITLAEGGRLADIAPTILAVMGLEQPKEMTGRALIK